MTTTVRVLIALALPEAYDYSVPEDLSVAVGDYVEVPLGKRRMVGVVWGEGSGTVPLTRLKSIIRRFDLPPLPFVNQQFIRWVAQYYLAPEGAVLRMAISVPQALENPRAAVLYELSKAPLPDGFRRSPAREKVLAFLDHGAVFSAADISAATGTSPAVIRGLADAGILTPRLHIPERVSSPLDTATHTPVFSPAQQEAVNVLTRHEDAEEFSATLLDGVTGSGKTEVFFEAVAQALKKGQQALVLLPEIALSSQVMDRFTSRFGQPPVSWHSGMTPAQRRNTWRAVAKGKVSVVVGARSALFLPFPNLGLIVVDEEHDNSYKQDEGVAYQARDMAVVRAHLGKIPVVLVSATPSLETLVNVENGKYQRVHLPTRHGVAVMPRIRLLDLRQDKPTPRRWLAPSLYQAMEETLTAGEQVLLFLNRRGYAPLTLCRTCGQRLQCSQCTAWLVEHRSTGRLHCHHCGHGEILPSACSACGTEDSFTACGPGVERIAEEIAMRFPNARRLVMASDLLTTAQNVEDALEKIRAKEVDIIVGTQIVAKGHHFPGLTLVGVVDADLGLSGGDLRAAERTFQLLQQVAGRAGREEKPGRVFLQTYQPDHPVMQALKANDRDTFLALEGEARRLIEMPPYGRLVALIVSGTNEEAVSRVASNLGRTAPRAMPHVVVLGPAPAPLSLIRGCHRRRLLLKAPRNVAVQSLVKDWLAQVSVPASVRVQVDVDPYNFL